MWPKKEMIDGNCVSMWPASDGRWQLCFLLMSNVRTKIDIQRDCCYVSLWLPWAKHS